ncbi:MAG: pyridoxamine 5'-phosphate oxidase family protein, partial [Verrucomicrobiales bacterium]|nr:pyridoxamine 5'-phosphate oxidase family protein [Verrucomicrobiales bacterium]
MSDFSPWLELLIDQRWAALGTLDSNGDPYVSGVAFCPVISPGPGLLMHLSQLAAHTGYLQSRPSCSLLIGEPDNGTGDPQKLVRLTLRGKAAPLARDSELFVEGAKNYITKFPESEMRFGLGDFQLFNFITEKGN